MDGVTDKKSQWLKVVLPIVAILAIIVSAIFFMRSQLVGLDGESDVHQSSGIQIGQTIDDLQLQILGGGKTQLSQVRGKVKLINFWATWCTPCVVEMPSLRRLREKFADQGFEIVFISLDEEPADVVKPALDVLKIDFQTYVDPEGEIAERFGVSALPLSVVIGPDRKVLHLEHGERNWDASDAHEAVAGWLK